MDSTLLVRLAVAALALGLIVFAILLPTVRLLRRTGRTGYVAERAPTPVHALAVHGFRISVAQLLVWVGLVLVRGPGALGVWNLPVAVAVAAVLAGAAGLVLIVVAQLQMGASWRIGIDPDVPTPLVTRGLFAHVRNPIFTGLLLWSGALVLLTPSAWTVMGWVFLAFNLALQVRLEEAHLLRMHGDAYRRYAAAAGRFVPRLGRLDALSAG